MKPLDVKPNPELQAAIRETNEGASYYGATLMDTRNRTVNCEAAIQEITAQVAVIQEMLRTSMGQPKYEKLQAKAINTLFPPTEEAQEIERLRRENEQLKAKLAQVAGEPDDTHADEQESEE